VVKLRTAGAVLPVLRSPPGGTVHREDDPLDPAISSLMASAGGGDSCAAEALFVALYGELHRMAQRKLASNADLTLGTTSLLHEAYLDMAGREGSRFPDRARFMAYASRVMRTLIIDYSRRRNADKRGGQFELVAADEAALGVAAADHEELLRISIALDELGAVEPPLAEVVDLKFFCGFTLDEIAAMHGNSRRTVQRQWDRARIYLHRALRDEEALRGEEALPDAEAFRDAEAGQ
jgi:RNA polymerase sigma factor (TIGR02999 family)